ncbi:MAG: ATP-binding protein, partial [Caldimicrobium sp.]
QKELVIEKIAGGLAHDLNNLLMIGKGYLEILEEKSKGFFEVEKTYIQKVREVFEKISHLVLELFILSRGEIKREEIVEINSFIKDWVNFLLTGTKINLKLELSPYDLFVPLQHSHLVSLVSNIVLNAREAMENVGELRIKVYKEGDLAVLEFEDTGKGIPREYLDKIFEPGFSTKPHGSGLGLFVVKRIVENYKGEILVRSEVKKGTTFIIKLPLATLKKRVVEEGEKRVEEKPVEKKKILILEDEAEIRELLREFLSEQGFEVVLFEEGDSAYEGFLRALEEKIPFHILLLDLTVPMGKGGVYFLKRLKDAGINLKDYKIILMTGYTEKEVKEEAKGFEFNAVLYKPFSIQKLIEVINL